MRVGWPVLISGLQETREGDRACSWRTFSRRVPLAHQPAHSPHKTVGRETHGDGDSTGSASCEHPWQSAPHTIHPGPGNSQLRHASRARSLASVRQSSTPYGGPESPSTCVLPQLHRPSLEHIAEAVLLIDPTDTLDHLRGLFERFPCGCISKFLRDVREGGGGHGYC
jgi:hypothetical protein